MTTSGSTAFGMSRDEIITAAVRKTGRLASGQTLTNQQKVDGAYALNVVIAQLQTMGVPLWRRTSTSFPLTLSTSTYTIGTGLTVNVPAPLKILQAFAVNTTTNYGVQMDITSIHDNSVNVLAVDGSLPTQLSYQPQIDAGTISIWPRPDSTAVAGIQIKIIYQAPFEMFSTAAGTGTETMDLPKEWHQALIYLLAVSLAPEWGVPLADRQMLKREADEYMERASAFGQEDGSIYFNPRRM